MPRHWMDKANLTCGGCGHASRSLGAEMRHRHNFPMLCKPVKEKKGSAKKTATITMIRIGPKQFPAKGL